MDPTDKLEKVENVPENEPEKRGGEKDNSEAEIDIFAGDLFEKPGPEVNKPDSAPESHSVDEEIVSGSQVDIVSKEVLAGSDNDEIKPDSAPESPSGNEHSATGSQVDIISGDVEGSTQETQPDSATAEPTDGESNEQGGHETKPDLKLSNPTVKQRNSGAKGKLSLFIVVGMSFVIGIGYICLKYDILTSNNEKLDIVPVKNVFPIPKGELITFNSFIVPFKKNERFTYISLSIVISLPNKELRNEISGKRDRIRGILYDMFTEEINRENRIPPIDHLKKSIIRTVNGVLSVDVVKEVFVTQFLAV
jgi:flagellar basal body-associated protein FliL